MEEEKAYILGTERAELHRLGIQHQIWAADARQGWKNGGFAPGDTILDLGCGPGFCTLDLAYIAGERGKVIAVDISPSYIKFLDENIRIHGVNVETIMTDFDAMELEPNSIDGIYHRWALAWIPNVDEIVKKLYTALKPGGVIVSHEYYDWSLFQTQPALPNIKKAIAGALRSFLDSPSDINVGKSLPGIMTRAGFNIESSRTISKIGYNNDLTWEWSSTFLEIYFPKVAEMGLIDAEVRDKALSELKKLRDIPGASIQCPLLSEIVSRKKV